jgi:MFS family permease
MRREIKILIETSLLFNIGVGLFAPIYAIFVENIGATIVDAGFAIGIYSIVFGILIILLGKVEDKYTNQRHMIFIGYIILAICALGYIFVQNATQLFILQIFIGIGAAILTPAWDAIFSKYEDEGKEAFEWSIWEGGVSIILGITAFLGGLIVVTFGWTLIFIIMFIFEIIGAISSFRLSISPEKKRRPRFLKSFLR